MMRGQLYASPQPAGQPMVTGKWLANLAWNPTCGGGPSAVCAGQREELFSPHQLCSKKNANSLWVGFFAKLNIFYMKLMYTIGRKNPSAVQQTTASSCPPTPKDAIYCIMTHAPSLRDNVVPQHKEQTNGILYGVHTTDLKPNFVI